MCEGHFHQTCKHIITLLQFTYSGAFGEIKYALPLPQANLATLIFHNYGKQMEFVEADEGAKHNPLSRFPVFSIGNSKHHRHVRTTDTRAEDNGSFGCETSANIIYLTTGPYGASINLSTCDNISDKRRRKLFKCIQRLNIVGVHYHAHVCGVHRYLDGSSLCQSSHDHASQ